MGERLIDLALFAEESLQRVLGQEDQQHEHRGPEGRQTGGFALDHQEIHQEQDRQQVMQAGFQDGACGGQVQHRVDAGFQIRARRRIAHGCNIGDQQACDQNRCRHRADERVCEGNHLTSEPEGAAADDNGACDDEDRAEHEFDRMHAAGAGHAHFQGFKVHDIDQRHIGNSGRHDGGFDHLDIRNADIFCHQEGHGAHHGRGQHPVDGRGDLNRARFRGGEAHFAHERDGECAGGDNIGDGGAGNEPGGCGGNHGRFGRAAAQVAKGSKGELQEVVACARLIEQGAKQHKQEHKAG